MKIEELKILVIGVGGLGCPAALSLAGAGVGTLGLMDPDRVEISNLHRQVLYSREDLGQLKVEVAARFLSGKYPGLRTIPLTESMSAESMSKRLEGYDLVVDWLDRLEKKFFLNDWCVKEKKGLCPRRGGAL